MTRLSTPRVRPAATADSIEFAVARLHARLAWRANDASWQRLRAARTLPALLDVARSTELAPYVAGVAATATLGELDLAFQAQLRHRIDEVAGWMPAHWQGAVRFTRLLIDLPASLSQPPQARHAATRAQRGAQQQSTVCASAGPLHPALAAWLRNWQQCWPRPDAALHAWAVKVGEDCAALCAADLEHAALCRERLAAQLMRDLHARAVPLQVKPFAFLALVALDLRRLRGECVRTLLDGEAQ